MNKKTKLIIAVCAVCVALAAIVGSVAYFVAYGPIKAKEPVSITEAEIEDIDDVYLIGHRGFSAVAPENTLKSFELACEAGFWGCEFDIQLTLDKTWVVMHDSNVKKMTGKSGKIEKKTFDELRSLEITNGANVDKYYGQKIPTLDETLGLLQYYDTVPVIEIKSATDEKVSEVYSSLRKYGMLERAWIISFEKEPLLKLRRMSEKVKLSYLVQKLSEEDIAFCTANRINGVDFNKKKNGENEVKMIVDAGLIPQAWTVDELDDLEEYYSYGVRYFTGNRLTY